MKQRPGSVIGITAVVLGVLILVLPDLLRWIAGVSLIVVGFFALFGRR